VPNFKTPPDKKQKSNLLDVLENMFDSKSRNIRTCQPAIVVEVDSLKGFVTVQPLIRTQKDNSGEIEVQDDVQYEVPIHFQSAQSGKARLSFPISKGTVGIVHYCERNRENWINSDGKTLQDSGNYNGVGMDGKLSPLYFVPEVLTPQSARQFSETDVVLDYNNSEFRITPDGIIKLTNGVFTTQYTQDSLTSTNGTITSTLNTDGSGEINNSLGSIKLESNGNINLNGVIFTPQGSVTLPDGQTLTATNVSSTNVAASASLTIDGVEMKDHKHKAGNELLDSGGNKCTGKTGETDA